MTKAETISLFELIVNDITELSTSEESALYDRVYRRICNKKPWVFLRTNASGTMAQDSTGYYIAIPTDFAFFLENDQYTDNSISYEGNAAPKVIFIGSTYQPIQIVNWTDRRKYFNQNNVAYADFAQNKIRFPQTPQYTTYDFDYVGIPTIPILTSATPVMPAQFHEMIAYGMAVENDVLQLSEKARSYMAENQAVYNQYMLDMDYWNALQVLN